MTFAIFAAAAILLSGGHAMASAGAPVPEGDDAKCESAWKIASPNGDTLSKDRATPFVVNYEMMDTNKNGSISQSEFQAGCGKGWIQNSDAATA